MSFASFANFYANPDYDNPLGPKRVAFGKQNFDSNELQLCFNFFYSYETRDVTRHC
jgi:hypothetical protein